LYRVTNRRSYGGWRGLHPGGGWNLLKGSWLSAEVRLLLKHIRLKRTGKCLKLKKLKGNFKKKNLKLLKTIFEKKTENNF